MQLAEQIKALAEKATAGPWEASTCLDYWVSEAGSDGDEGLIAHCGDIDWPDYAEKQPEWAANAALIVALRNNLPSIIAALEAQAWRADAQFLIDRIDELEWDLPDGTEFVRQWLGHVDPPLCRLRSHLAALPLPSPPEGEMK